MWPIQRTGLLLLAVALIGSQSCRTADQRARIAELQGLAQELPKFPDFKQVRYEDISKPGIAIVTYYYKSPTGYASVKEFYRQELSARGWTEEKQEGWFVDSDSPATFQKGNYKIILTRDDILVWQYTIDFSWRS
jgi:hypothetical protein